MYKKYFEYTKYNEYIGFINSSLFVGEPVVLLQNDNSLLYDN